MEEAIRYSKPELLNWQETGEEEGQWQSIAAAFPPELLNATSRTASTRRRRRHVDPTQHAKHQHVPALPEISACASTLPSFLEPREDFDDNMCSLDERVNSTDEEEYDSHDSDDGVSLQPLAFMVEGEPDFESGSPQDGFEYLRRVMWETARCPKVKVAKIGEKKLTAEQTKYMPEIAPIPTCSRNLLPSKEWVHTFLKDFSALRVVISNSRASEDGNFEVLPPIRNKSVWQSVCFGLSRSTSSTVASDEHNETVDIACALTDPYSTLNHDDNACLRTDHPFPSFNGNASACSPYLKLLLRLDENSRATLFRYHVSWLNEERQLAHDRAMWLFALAAAVDSPLDDQTSAAFRDLLRKCAELRSWKTAVDEELYMLNILMTIAGPFFGQAEDFCTISA